MNQFKNIEALDCTIRDGGYINNWDFPTHMVKDIYRRLSQAGIHVIELGFRDSPGDDSAMLWRQCPEDILHEIKGDSHGARICVMVDFGKTTLDDFILCKDSAIDMVRVAVHKNKVEEGVQFASKLKEKGYETSIQLMGYAQYSTEERKRVLDLFSSSYPDYVYVADSYGSLLPEQIKELIEPFVEIGKFKVGFHPHNNLQLAFANTLEAIRCGATIFDSSLYGMGRGAGNLPTEVIISYLKSLFPEKWNSYKIFEAIDLHIIPIRKKYEWGHMLPYMLAGITKCHPYYARELVEKRKFTIGETFEILSVIGKRNPVGFDQEELEKVVEKFSYDQRTKPIDNRLKPMSTVDEQKPGYLNRHQGADFLILANGPSLMRCREQIKKFIDEKKPMVMGGNFLGDVDVLIPDYHAFTNKRRFAKFINTVHEKSSLLLSSHFEREFIKEYSDRECEFILLDNDMDEEIVDLENGHISYQLHSFPLALIAVAMGMGAKEIFIAGLDGFLRQKSDGQLYYYNESDFIRSEQELMELHMHTYTMLEKLNTVSKNKLANRIKIITPTTYERFYSPC
ncbi:MAG: aldolase catalytic domain-containing protein [Desulfobulbaceae bacterium]|nr:aldolase catalytic domain-containing protein [Desulfobulbaceae bacterium]